MKFFLTFSSLILPFFLYHVQHFHLVANCVTISNDFTIVTMSNYNVQFTKVGWINQPYSSNVKFPNVAYFFLSMLLNRKFTRDYSKMNRAIAHKAIWEHNDRMFEKLTLLLFKMMHSSMEKRKKRLSKYLRENTFFIKQWFEKRTNIHLL